MIYNLIFFSSAVSNFVTFKKFDLRRVLYALTLIVFFVFVAFRWDVGCDWGSYLHHADVYGPSTIGEALDRTEQGYWLLVIFLYRMGFDYPAINVIAAFVFFLGIHSIARKQPDPLMYMSLLFPILITGIPMSATRQAMAMGFVCLAFAAYCERRAVAYLVWTLAAAQFHSSAIFFLCLFPFLLARTFKTKVLVSVFLVAPVAIYLLNSDTVKTYTDLYVGTIHDASGGPARGAIVAATGLAFLVFLRKRWKAHFPDDYELILNTCPIMLAVLPVTLYSSVIGDRFGYYLMPLAYAVQSRAYMLMRSSAARFIAFVTPFAVGAVALLVWSQMSWIFTTCYLPYQTWWQSH